MRLMEVNPVSGGIVMQLLQGAAEETEQQTPEDGWDPLGGPRRAKTSAKPAGPGRGRPAGKGKGGKRTKVKGKIGRAKKPAGRKGR